ncbi:hypothetical protein AB0L14_21145 [Streptomyces sp. NPDC052727]|uniref:hypothetical protein n=1 Tax=Streptomyces sp. NPDC052727 TaxID=3154854 RepID=UPI003426D3B8
MHRDESASVDSTPVLDWQVGSTLRWIDRPEEVDAAFDRGEPLVGVAVIALALNHVDADVILPRVSRAMESEDAEIRRQGVIALAHVARLHRTVDQRSLALLRAGPRGNEADDDLWSFVAHRRLPWCLAAPLHAAIDLDVPRRVAGLTADRSKSAFTIVRRWRDRAGSEVVRPAVGKPGSAPGPTRDVPAGAAKGHQCGSGTGSG